MKVTRKFSDELPKLVKGKKDDVIAPSLYLRGLPKGIDGLEAGQDFHGRIKGKCRAHSVDHKEDGTEHHTYDLDVHDYEHDGSGGGDDKKSAPKKKTSREEVEEAMDKYDKEKSEKKEKK